MPIMLFLILILIFVILLVVITNIVIVPQSMVYVVERLGSYSETWSAGLHVKIPFLERVAKKVSLKEQVADFPPQPVITRDNVTMQIDTVVFFQVMDAKLYTYGVNQPIGLARVGNFLSKRFSDFDVRNYGYSKLSTFLESMNNSEFQLVKLHGGYFVQEKSASISKTEIEKEIIRMIRENKGHVDNLSIVHEELKKAFPSFDVKQYGFSRISSFIRSFGTFKIKDNMIQMR